MPIDEALERRLRAIEDHDAIRTLKAYYARCADEKYTDDHHRLPQAEIDAITRRQVEATFTPDAVWDGGPQFGRREGREAIYDHLRAGGWNFSLHYFLSPVIEVTGDTAHASWMLWQPCTFTEGNRDAICPGIIDTPLFRTSFEDAPDPQAELARIIDRYLIKRPGRPEDIAAAALFLSSSESAYMTGSAIAVDGGRTFH